ncbi:hypothetical protein Scep_007134 [Stephania cephalantha]|uniref:Uncharacterized protein n=1 Tax=Stephania cephalantha TaxID=152367 RepID=A0AAP0K9H2_9MAGN
MTSADGSRGGWQRRRSDSRQHRRAAAVADGWCGRTDETASQRRTADRLDSSGSSDGDRGGSGSGCAARTAAKNWQRDGTASDAGGPAAPTARWRVVDRSDARFRRNRDDAKEDVARHKLMGRNEMVCSLLRRSRGAHCRRGAQIVAEEPTYE